jgi:type I restriction-modification system DNA methylase subunit
MNAETHSQLANFIWSICNLLRGPYKRNEYRKVILPLTVLRRFDCLLAPTKAHSHDTGACDEVRIALGCLCGKNEKDVRDFVPESCPSRLHRAAQDRTSHSTSES